MSRLDELRASPFFGVEIGLATQRPDFIGPFHGWLVYHEFASAEARLGQLLCSAIVNGALLDRSCWQAWLEAVLRDHGKLERGWICFETPSRTMQSGSRARQWFADPITALLLRKFDDTPAVTSTESADNCLLWFFRSRFIHRPRLFNEASINELLSWATMQWRLRMPALLVDQALGNNQTTSLNAHAYSKLVGLVQDNERAATSTTSSSQTLHDASTRWFKAYSARNTREGQVFRHIREMRQRSAYSPQRLKRICASWLLEYMDKEGLPPARAALLNWCVAQLTLLRRNAPQGLAPYTVENKLLAVLQGVFSGQYPYRLEELQPKAVLARLGRSSQRERNPILRKAMRDATFDFLRFQKCPDQWASKVPLRLRALENEDAGEAVVRVESVRPEIISDLEYSRCLSLARSWNNGGELSLIIMLGYRTGLRMPEILGLQTCDFVTAGQHYEIHLEKNSFRALKTETSRRIIPLDVLMPPHELSILRDWLEPRLAAAKKRNAPQLCFGPQGGKILPSDKAREFQIGKILSKIAGRKLTFYCLRHSFSSYLALKLLLPEPTSELLIPKSFRNVVNWEHSRQVRNRLIGRAAVGQPAMHAVSMLMGHTGIPRTLKSYQHLLDLAVHLYCVRAANMLPVCSFIREELGEVVTGTSLQNQDLVEHKFLPSYLKSWEPLQASTDDERPVHVPALAKKEQGSFLRSGVRASFYPSKRASRLETATPDQPTDHWRRIYDWVSQPARSPNARLPGRGASAVERRKWRRSHDFLFGEKPRPNRIVRLYPPRGSIAEEIVATMWERRDILSVDDQKLLRTFFNGFMLSTASCRFDTEKQAHAFAHLLRRLGVAGEHIGIAFGSKDDLRECQKHAEKMISVEGLVGSTSRKQGVLFRTSIERPVRNAKSSKKPALWISYVKLEPDELGWSFDTRHRLDALQEQRDQKTLASGGQLTPRRAAAREKRQVREAARVSSVPTGKADYKPGTGAYLFGLEMLFIYHGITADFPKESDGKNANA